MSFALGTTYQCSSEVKVSSIFHLLGAALFWWRYFRSAYSVCTDGWILHHVVMSVSPSYPMESIKHVCFQHASSDWGCQYIWHHFHSVHLSFSFHNRKTGVEMRPEFSKAFFTIFHPSLLLIFVYSKYKSTGKTPNQRNWNCIAQWVKVAHSTTQRREDKASTEVCLRELFKLKTSAWFLGRSFHYFFTVSLKNGTDMQ
jgi:hypothetical protein